MVTLGRAELQDLEPALEREWLETNGLGSYASSTVLCLNTRKYHGLLTVALDPPVRRAVLVSRVDETLVVGESRFQLSASEYQDTIYPDGFRYLEQFRLDPFPIFTYAVGAIRLEKSVFMVRGRDTTCLLYSLSLGSGAPPADSIALEIRPLLACRDHHLLQRERPDFDRSVEVLKDAAVRDQGLLRIRPIRDLPPVYLAFSIGEFARSGYWYRNYLYRREKENGYDAREDLYSPGVLTFGFGDRSPACLAFSTEEASADPALADLERARRATLAKPLPDPVAEAKHKPQAESRRPERILWPELALAADAFVAVRGEEGRTLIAGYPWFADWGRDSMISLPGIALSAGRYDDARKILETYAASMRHGLIPNLFSDMSRSAQYNTIDATLWFFEAVKKYYDATGDGEFVTSVLPRLRDSLSAHIAGTLYGIKADEDGLLRGGAEGVQLTWMDAKFGERVITARTGKPVEVNALWYNALRTMADFCGEFGGLAEERRYDELAARAHKAFNLKFWNDERACLYDTVDVICKDDSVRPNQIIAMSLSYPVLDQSKWKPVVDIVERELLTPYGLRTLSPNDPRYRGTYQGTLEKRDNAYHQGTVWAWLLGHFITAYLRAYGRSPRTVSYCSQLLEPFVAHLSEAGMGQISEIFDGDPPHHPRGCIAQAWSVAEILRAIFEDILPPCDQSRTKEKKVSSSKEAA